MLPLLARKDRFLLSYCWGNAADGVCKDADIGIKMTGDTHLCLHGHYVNTKNMLNRHCLAATLEAFTNAAYQKYYPSFNCVQVWLIHALTWLETEGTFWFVRASPHWCGTYHWMRWLYSWQTNPRNVHCDCVVETPTYRLELARTCCKDWWKRLVEKNEL